MVQKANEHSVSAAKVALCEEMHKATDTALARYALSGGDTRNGCAKITIIISDDSGRASVCVSEEIDFELHQKDYVTFIRDGQAPVQVELQPNPRRHDFKEGWQIGDLLKKAGIVLGEHERVFDEDENMPPFKLTNEIDWQWAGGKLFIRA